MLHFCLLKKIFLFIFFNYWHFFAFPSILLCIFHVQSSKYNQNNTAPLRQTQESFLFPFSATQSRFKPGLGLFFAYTNRAKYDIIPSLTLENSKTAITPVFYQRCFFYNRPHGRFGYEFVVCSEAKRIMQGIRKFCTFVGRYISTVFRQQCHIQTPKGFQNLTAGKLFTQFFL